MKTLQEKIEAIKEGTKFNIPMISLKSKISRVTDKAIELGGGNGWIPKSAIVSFDELTGEMQLSLWLEKKLNEKSRTNSGAY
jgi:CRISPR/Cas system CSM-associated protein Csm5 (group 7 of RAMP superfamily)